MDDDHSNPSQEHESCPLMDSNQHNEGDMNLNHVSMESNDDSELTDQQIEDQIHVLVSLLEKTPDDHPSRVQLISLYRLQGQFEMLRMCLEELANMIPLPEDLWLEWLQDEEQLAFDANGQILSHIHFDSLNALYQRATREVWSSKIYIAWVKCYERIFVSELQKQASQGEEPPSSNNHLNHDQPVTSPSLPLVDIQSIRSLYEIALNQFGYDFNHAYEIWSQYRNFESTLLLLDDDPKTRLDSIKKIRMLFHLEIQTPHIALTNVYHEEYLLWEESVAQFIDPLPNDERERVEHWFQQSQIFLERVMPSEMKIQQIEESLQNRGPSDYWTVDYDKIYYWYNYINNELHQDPINPKWMISLFERALKTYSLVQELWTRYSLFSMTKATFPSPNQQWQHILSLLRRSVRYCPSSCTLWCYLMVAIEKGQHELNEQAQEMTNTLQRALISGLNSGEELWLVYKQYLDYRTRMVEQDQSNHQWQDIGQVTTLRQLLDSTSAYFEQYFPNLLPQVIQYQVAIEWHKIRDLDKVRVIYEQKLNLHPKDVQTKALQDTTLLATSSEIWIQFINFECQIGQIENARKLYQLASKMPSNSPQWIWREWMDFERVFGSLDQYLQALIQCSYQQQEVIKKDEKTSQRKNKREKLKQGGLPESGDKSKKTASIKLSSSRNKRQIARDDESGQIQNELKPISIKRSKLLNLERMTTDFDPMDQSYPTDEKDDQDGEDHYSKPQTELSDYSASMEISTSHHGQQDNRTSIDSYRRSKDDSSLSFHVSGLPPLLPPSQVESKLYHVFHPLVSIAKVYVPVNAQGKHKGYAFVKVENIEQAQIFKEAISKNSHTFSIHDEDHVQQEADGAVLTSVLHVSPSIKSSPNRSVLPPADGATPQDESHHTIYVSNLSHDMNTESLKTLLIEQGISVPSSIRVPLDRRTGKSRPFAYLDYDDQETINQVVIKLNQVHLNGKKINAAPSVPTKYRIHTGKSRGDGETTPHQEQVNYLVPRAILTKMAQKKRISLDQQKDEKDD